jgi:hypothetical protein
MSHGSRLRVAAVAAALLLTMSSTRAAPKTPQEFNVVPITITGVVVQDGQLIANGLIGTTPFQVPLTLTAEPLQAGATCPVLHLSLGPIHLALLGLNVDTSAICLNITAIEGGGLLGNLLCQLGTGLNAGASLSSLLTALSADQLATLTNGLTTLLNQAVFGPLTSSSAVASASCPVLNLSLGPLDLTLLGLNVHLDNCANGPVTLSITANPAGGLLGQLLCGLSNALNGGAPAAALTRLLHQIAAVIGQLLG